MQFTWIMDKLIKELKQLENNPISKVIEKRLKEFKALNRKPSWFSELCFCLLTANSKAQTAINIQKELDECFHIKTKDEISLCIRKHKHRFHNNKSKYIMEARKYTNIKDIIIKEKEPREWLVKNIKGMGYKEASHFLRNVGYDDYAILDRHIIRVLHENNYIKEIPKTLNKKLYLEIEDVFRKIAKKMNKNLAELDLYMWFIKTGKVLK